MINTDILILGCSWSELLVSIRAKTLYPSADVVFIGKDLHGRLLKSKVINGYLFDIGGAYVVFSRRRDVIKGIVSMGGEWIARVSIMRVS
jgi:protoporphyrinogen oxidase